MDKKFLDPTSVNDVETARLALRWSLEKIHALQDELNKAKETATDAVDKLRLTTEQIAQKDAAILRWQSTIKAWEANYKDQAKLEAEIRARLAKEMTFEEDAGHKEARRQLELHIEAFKTEIREKEAAMGDLRRQIIDAVKTAILTEMQGYELYKGAAERTTDPEARRIASFLPQKVAFPDALTGREVVEFYRQLREADPARTGVVLTFASLNGAGERPVGTYSGGMVQRLGLAVAMLPAAPVLLLDEPMAALDPTGLRAFHDLVSERRRDGQTILFTSHQLGDVEHLADRFAVMVGGRLVALLSARELADRLADRGVMRLRVDRRPDGLLERLRALAPAATWQGDDELIVPGRAAGRLAALDVVRDAGVEIRSLTTDEGRLDAFYRELVGEEP